MVHVPVWLLVLSYVLIIMIAIFAIAETANRDEGKHEAPPVTPMHGEHPRTMYEADIARRQYPAPEGWVLIGFKGYMRMFREEDRLPVREHQEKGQPVFLGLDGVKTGCTIYTLTPDQNGINVHVDRRNDDRPILVGTVSTRQEAIECVLIDDEPYVAKREEQKAKQYAVDKNAERLFERH